jgi:ubiquitin-conjugating enzyme E2 R
MSQQTSSSTAGPSTSSATRALAMELKGLQMEPVEGFTVSLNDENIFDWRVAIFGPPGTVYEGGYFKARLRFPSNYPYLPPAMKFLTSVYHPNVYDNGDLCISILHPPVDDPRSGELVCERWNPTQNVRTILLSVISLLNEPNTMSPANVDASVLYRKWRDGVDKEYERIVKAQVAASRVDAEKDGVFVPTTVEEYCKQSSSSLSKMNNNNDEDFDMDYDDHYYDYGDDDSPDDEEEEEHFVGDTAEDSGQGES